MKCGGTNQFTITDGLRHICDTHRDEITTTSQGLGRNGVLTTFQVVEALSQVVAGINYFVNIRVGEKEHLWARIHQDLGGKTYLQAVRVNLTPNDTLEYFEPH
jgi:hypothetical protein